MKTFLAIDFGTTQTSVARLMEGSERPPEVIEVNDGQRTVKAITTAMQLDEQGNILYFGAKALAKAEEAPERTFQNFKVFIGHNDLYQSKTEQNTYTPDDLARLFLVTLRKQIEDSYFNGSTLTQMKELNCIIGCPSDWNDVQKNNLKNIAASAGFPNVRLCDEPIGVIYYNHFYGGLKLEKSQKILVYDFGGGTTDVAVAKVEVSASGKIEPSILSVSGIPDLGGRNFDDAISAYYMMENGYDLSTLSVKDRLHDSWVIGLASRGVKEELSGKGSAEKTINRLKVTEGRKPERITLNRKIFADICAGLIKQCEDPVLDALDIAGLSAEDIDAVILAGGSSNMPFVRERMSKIFPAGKIILSPSVDIIAQGLAVFGKAEALGMKAKVSESIPSGSAGTSTMQDYFKKEQKKSNDTPPVTKITTGIPQKEEPKNNRKWLWAAVIGIVVLMMGIFVSGQNSAIPEDQKKLEAELNRVRAEKEKAERECQAAERARIEAERKARSRPLTKSAIKNIIESYGFDLASERLFGFSHTILSGLREGEEEIGYGQKFFSFHPYVVFTTQHVVWILKNGDLVGWSYEQIRNNVTEAEIRSELSHLPNAQNVINAVLEIKNY